MRKGIILSVTALLGMFVASCNQKSDAPEQAKVTQPSTATRAALEMEPSLTRDSLTLVSFYEQTNGEEWWKQRGWLSDTPLTEWRGVKVAEVNGEPRVVELRLGGNNIKGEIPTILGLLTELQALDLKYNYDVSGNIPHALYDLRALRVLNLRFTSVTGSLSEKIGQWTEMDSLSLRTSPWPHRAIEKTPNQAVMTGELPKEIGQLTKLTFLDLGRQKFSGTLPEELGNCVSLQELDIENNNFSGPLPSSITKLTQLHSLFAQNNKISGELPEGMGKMTALEYLDLDDNQIEGALPVDLVQLPRLRQLDLANNRLTGELPVELGQAKRLFTIQLQGNQLEGDFRPVIVPLLQSGEMFYIDLSNNNFTGEVPSQPKWPAKHTRLYLKGNRITGEVPSWYLSRPAEVAHLLPQQSGYGFSNVK